MTPVVRIQREDFDLAAEIAATARPAAPTSAPSSPSPASAATRAGRWQRSSSSIIPAWPRRRSRASPPRPPRAGRCSGLLAIHRYGLIRPGEQIVLVVAASAHRRAAFEAADFMMDYLKTRAPFWKREHLRRRHHRRLGRGQGERRRRGRALGLTEVWPSRPAELPSLATVLGRAQLRPPTGSKTFRDWMAGCDNLKAARPCRCPPRATRCRIPEARAAGRHCGPARADAARQARSSSATRGRARIGRRALSRSGRPAGRRRRRGDRDRSRSAAEAEALITAARKAHEADAEACRQDLRRLARRLGRRHALDRRAAGQARTRTTALIRKGPATTVPAAPAAACRHGGAAGAAAFRAKAAKAMTVALRKQLKQLDPDLCEDSPTRTADADSVWSLDDAQRLVGLLCSRGAYNVTTGFWIVAGRDVAKARKARVPAARRQQDNVLSTPIRPGDAARSASYGKGRGIGDCGSARQLCLDRHRLRSDHLQRDGRMPWRDPATTGHALRSEEGVKYAGSSSSGQAVSTQISRSGSSFGADVRHHAALDLA